MFKRRKKKIPEGRGNAALTKKRNDNKTFGPLKEVPSGRQPRRKKSGRGYLTPGGPSGKTKPGGGGRREALETVPARNERGRQPDLTDAPRRGGKKGHQERGQKRPERQAVVEGLELLCPGSRKDRSQNKWEEKTAETRVRKIVLYQRPFPIILKKVWKKTEVERFQLSPT